MEIVLQDGACKQRHCSASDHDIYATSLSMADNLYINYYPSNTAVSDSIMAIVTNSQSFAFENALVKFLMPSGNQAYSVTGGVLEQVDRSGSHNVCYVRVNLTANSVNRQ
jgi:hypothetical protein